MGVKFLSFGEPVKVVSVHDDAIDKVAMGVEGLKAYQENYDVSHLKLKEGATPTYFNLSNVAGPDLVVIQQDHYKTELPEMNQTMSAEEMKNLKVKVVAIDQGMMLVKYFKAGVKSYSDNGVETEINEETLRTVPPMIISEFGSFIMSRSTLGEAKKKS